jgi:Ca2+-binding RTX toxin-like protein
VDTTLHAANVTKIDINGGNGGDNDPNFCCSRSVPISNGGAGADFIAGGGGNDTIDGGADDDQMYGNGGADAFQNVEAGDTVTDFNPGEGDTQTASANAVKRFKRRQWLPIGGI